MDAQAAVNNRSVCTGAEELCPDRRRHDHLSHPDATLPRGQSLCCAGEVLYGLPPELTSDCLVDRLVVGDVVLYDRFAHIIILSTSPWEMRARRTIA